MIRGKVNSQREAVIRFPIHSFDGRVEEVVAVIDAGFDDYLTLPTRFIEDLGLPFEISTEVILADGSLVQLDCYRATVNWDGELRNVIVTGTDSDPLVGMTMSEGFDIRIRNIIGGEVVIEKIP